MTKPKTIAEINALSPQEFVALLGGIFEHAPWVAERSVSHRPFANRAALLRCMVGAIKAADDGLQLALIRAHPELADKAAVGTLTPESTQEQSGAGLNQCSAEEYRTLIDLNADYNDKFGFPFILAVRGYDPAGIIAEFTRRCALPVAEERAECLRQIYKIGGFRLADVIADVE